MTFDEFKRQQIEAGVTDSKEISKNWHTLIREKPVVGSGVSVHLWTDAEAYTVIARTAQTLTLQRAKAEYADDYKPEYIPGGFGAYCTNDGAQKWNITPDPNGSIVKAHWSEAKCGFYVQRSLRVSYGYYEHYDHNF